MSLRSKFLIKISSNKILVILLGLFLLTAGIGFYYNQVRELKTTYHYTIKDGPDKEYRIFFERPSEIDEDKKVLEELFRFKYGTIINITPTKAYYISNQTETGMDKIYEYDFNLRQNRLVFSNPEEIDLQDAYLFNNKLTVLTKNKLIDINISDLQIVEKQFSASSQINEILNIRNSEIIFGFDNCKFDKAECRFQFFNQVVVLNQNDNSQKIVPVENNMNEYFQDLDFWGTNKVYKLGNVARYEEDKGNRNYTLRMFTRF